MRVHQLARIGWAAAIVSAAAVVPLGVAPASAAAAAPAPGWHLVSHHQSACFDGNVHDAWYGVFVKGTWTHAITVSMQHLPAGATFTTSYSPIAPGSSKGQFTLAYADAKLANNTPLGKYTAWLSASDGTTRDHIRVVLNVTDDCGY